MSHSLPKFLLCFIVSVYSTATSAQVYLDYAKIHINLTPIGAYDINQTPNGDYYVVDNYISNQSDMDPDEDNKVQVHSSFLSAGLYLAKYDKNGKYLNHTYIKGGTARNQLTRVISNDSFVVLMCQGYDSVVFGGVDGFRLSSPGYATYIVKYNQDLQIVESLVLKNDSVDYGNLILEANGNLLIYGGNSGILNFDIKGTPILIDYKNENRVPNTGDIFLLRLDKELNYVSHSNFGIRGTETFNQILVDKSGQVYLSGYASFRDTSFILGDTIAMSNTFGYGTSPLILKYSSDLQLIDYYYNDLLTSNNMTRISNGNILMVCDAKLTSQSYGFYLVLMDSNFNEKGRILRSGGSSASNTLGDFYGFEYKDGNFGLAISGGIFYFKDSNVTLNGNAILVLDKDSLHLIAKHDIKSPMKRIYHIDTQNILATVEFNGELLFQNGVSTSPPFAIGDPLYPTIQHTAIVNHRYDCTPVTTYLQYDTQVNCADQYGMSAGRGNVRLISQGSGAAFQWYNASNPTFKLNDQASPLQGGQSWRGMKSSYYRYSAGATNYLFNQLIARVGGSCTAPYWSDTGTQIIWGSPRMIATESSKNVTQGGSDSIIAYMDDKNYPQDSIEFQWYRGGAALIDGLRFHGARTQKLYINNIKDFDQGIFTCVASRIHCRDFNAVLGSSTYVNVKITGVRDIKNSAISIYPNPTSSLLNIQSDLTSKIQQIEVYDAVGKLQFKLFGEITQIDVSKLYTGIFILKITTENQVYSTQFIKN